MSTRIQLLSGLVCVAMAAAFSTTLQAADLEAGRKTFEQVCAACHGPAGRPDPNDPVVKALDPQPADLSDPLFNSRAPADDWQIVVTHGGPALGLSAVMPAQAGALKADEIANVVAYAKTLAPGSAPARHGVPADRGRR
jgi:mono/diheme cytochrome c family protein